VTDCYRLCLGSGGGDGPGTRRFAARELVRCRRVRTPAPGMRLLVASAAALGSDNPRHDAIAVQVPGTGQSGGSAVRAGPLRANSGRPRGEDDAELGRSDWRVST